MKINKDHPMPIYFQLKKIIESQIDQGLYHPGGMIPSERKLSETYGISRMTTRQAINELVKEGRLYREKGRGTFVAAPQLFQDDMMSFTETLKAQGHVPSTKVLEFCMVRNLKTIGEMLDMCVDQAYYKIKRLRLADGIPVALEIVYIPSVYCSGLEEYDLSGSLYKILKEQYNHTIESTVSKIEAVISDRMMMKVFDVKKQIPLLKVEGLTQNDQGKKLFYEISHYRSDLYTYRVNMQRTMMQWR